MSSDRCPLWRESHPLCRLKNPTVISIWLLVGFHPANRSVQTTPADNTRKRVWQYIEKERMQMNTAIYEVLEKTDVSWCCFKCGIPNFDTSLFEDFEATLDTSRSSISTGNGSFNISNIGHPKSASSPNPRNHNQAKPQDSQHQLSEHPIQERRILEHAGIYRT